MHASHKVLALRSRFPQLALGCLLSLVLAPAAAQDDGNWSAQVTPYLWGSGIDGKATPFTGAPTISFERSFSEVLEDLDAAFFVSGFARRDRFVLLGDLSYSSSSKEGRIPPGLPAEGELQQTSLTVAAGYRLLDDGRNTVDVLAGARLWRIRAEVAVPLAGIARSPTEEFADPMVAVRANLALGDRWSTLLYIDAGGFGVGSQHTYQLLGTLNYRMSERAYLSGGYRRLGVDYTSGGTRVDAALDGPLLGFTWRF